MPAELKEESYRKKARSGDYDLVIFDRCAPDESDMPMSDTFSSMPAAPWTRGDKSLKNPLMMPSKQQHRCCVSDDDLGRARVGSVALRRPKNLDPRSRN